MSKKKELHSLLELLNDTHRHDMNEVIIGHLNENNILENHAKKKPSNIKQKWSTSSPRKSPQRLNSTNHKLPPIDQKVNFMKDTLANFSIGPKMDISSKRRIPVQMESNEVNDTEQHVLRSENILSDTMLPLPSKQKDNMKFHPNPLLYPTKQEQYKQQKKLQDNILGKNETVNITSTNQKVDHIEDKIVKRLGILKKSHDVLKPSFFKWQIYSDAWDELCDSVETFQPLVKNIKKDSDTYVNKLIDAHTESTEPLQTKLNLISQADNHCDIKQAKEKVRILEERIMKELNENNRLRGILNDFDEIDQSEADPDEANESIACSNIHDRHDDLETKVEFLHTQIELKLRELNKLRQEQKEKYVPVTVCERLEHCIKETEIDIQKLCKQNEFLEHNLEELEEELEDVLVKTGMKEKDARLLWRKVSTSKLQDL